MTTKKISGLPDHDGPLGLEDLVEVSALVGPGAYESTRMTVEDYVASLVALGVGGADDHGALTGLADDDHTQYVLAAGRSGGQTIRGDTASGGNLTLTSNPLANGRVNLNAAGTVYLQESTGHTVLLTAQATSLALNGATIGAKKLAVAGDIGSIGSTANVIVEATGANGNNASLTLVRNTSSGWILFTNNALASQLGHATASFGVYNIETSTLGLTLSTAGALTTAAGATFNGNVGIGTIPLAPLHVIGTSHEAWPGKWQVLVDAPEAYNASPTAGVFFRTKYSTSEELAGLGGVLVGKENATDGNYASFLSLCVRAHGSNVNEALRFSSTSAATFTAGATFNGQTSVRQDQNADSYLLVENATAGTAAQASFRAKNNIGAIGEFGNLASTYTPAGLFTGNQTYVYGGGNGGIAIAADFGPIRFSAGGSNEQMQLSASGNLGIGVTPTYRLDILQTQDAASRFRMKNGSNGGSAQVLWQLENDLGNAVQIGMQGSGAGGAGYFQVNAGPLTVRTLGANNLVLATNNTAGLTIDGTTQAITAAASITAAAPISPGTYTVATLPTAGTARRMAYASNGRKAGEGGGAGTGVIVFDDGTNWIAVDTGAAVAA